LEPRHIPRIFGKRFALTLTAYKYLDIDISVGPVSSVEIVIGDNKGNLIILPHATWKTFNLRRAYWRKRVTMIGLENLTVELNTLIYAH